MLCAVLIPAVFAYFAGHMIVGPLFWAGRSIGLHRQSWRLLGPARSLDLTRTKAPSAAARLNQIALTAWSWRARDYEGEKYGLRVLVRTQPRTVGSNGEPLGFPWTQRDRSEAQQVLGLWVVIDTAERLPTSLDLHVAVGRDDAVVGDEALAVALLDGGIRRWAQPGDQLTISEQLVGYDAPLAIGRAEPDELVSELARMARRLVDAVRQDGGIDRAGLLLDNAQRDDNAEVRARSVDMLLERFEETAEAALVAALDDPAPVVRFAAARHLGRDGLPIVLEVLDAPGADEGLRERALRYLLRTFPRSDTMPVVERIIRTGQGSVRNIAIRHAGELQHAPAVEWMAPLAESADARTAVDIATAMSTIGGPEAEPVLLTLLQRTEHYVQMAAVDALGWVGQLASVERLLALSKRRITQGRLQMSATMAIQMIQARRARTGSGALSVVDQDGDGQLSLTAPGGAISLPKDGPPDVPS